MSFVWIEGLTFTVCDAVAINTVYNAAIVLNPPLSLTSSFTFAHWTWYIHTKHRNMAMYKRLFFKHRIYIELSSFPYLMITRLSDFMIGSIAINSAGTKNVDSICYYFTKLLLLNKSNTYFIIKFLKSLYYYRSYHILKLQCSSTKTAN